MEVGHIHLNLNEPPIEDGFVRLQKDRKTICRVHCINPPVKVPPCWIINDIKETSKFSLSGLPRFFLHPAFESNYQQREWGLFTSFLRKHNRAAVTRFESCEFYILPPDVGTNFSDAVVLFRLEKTNSTFDNRKHDTSDEAGVESTHLPFSENFLPRNIVHRFLKPGNVASPNTRIPSGEVATSSNTVFEGIGDSLDTNVRERDFNTRLANQPPDLKSPQTAGDRCARESGEEACWKSQPMASKKDDCLEKNFVRADPSYLKTLGQSHGWIFGAIAELVDNSRDAKASKLEISIEILYSKKDGKDIPMLSVIDDGHGMSHQDIVRMLSFGRKEPDGVDPDCIGRFGIGFKTGAMRLGRDAIVLTQTIKSRSIGFLSQSLNEGKDNLEIPIVSYYRQGSVMEVDTNVQSEASANYHLNAIKEFSPFNEYFIGEKLGLFREKGTGTQIYIWNLDEWGSDYCLEWQNEISGNNSSHFSDILIRSRRKRVRPGQISQKVPLDYSLQSYLEVIFLDPRMKIYVQGSLVKCRPLAKSLNKTIVVNGEIMGKPVQLILGRCQLEWEQMNCGIFLYWHGRLIEAYKRVGSMVHNPDLGRGVIGVIDVTDLMNNGKEVWVVNHKQGFQDCEAYAKLEEWLGQRVDEYWDQNFDPLELKTSNARYKQDNDWVQCNKCRKWRKLSSDFDTTTLPQDWFCYMAPYKGKCETPEQEVEPGVITVAAKRSGCEPKQKLVICKVDAKKINTKRKLEVDTERPGCESKKKLVLHCETAKKVGVKQKFEGDSDTSSQTVEVVRLPLKRLRRGLSRRCRNS